MWSHETLCWNLEPRINELLKLSTSHLSVLLIIPSSLYTTHLDSDSQSQPKRYHHGQRRHRDRVQGTSSSPLKEAKDLAYFAQSLLDIPAQKQNLPGLDKNMDPLAEFTKLECWDDAGKPYLKEVSTDIRMIAQS